MRDGDFEYLICSSPDREKVSCEIYYKDEILADISQERDDLMLMLFSRQNKQWWEIPYVHFKNALEAAQKHLTKTKD